MNGKLAIVTEWIHGLLDASWFCHGSRCRCSSKEECGEHNVQESIVSLFCQCQKKLNF
jgi:hypothetical protein